MTSKNIDLAMVIAFYVIVAICFVEWGYIFAHLTTKL
jgi:hypothetical protein